MCRSDIIVQQVFARVFGVIQVSGVFPRVVVTLAKGKRHRNIVLRDGGP
jgi:hypothetical protein